MTRGGRRSPGRTAADSRGFYCFLRNWSRVTTRAAAGVASEVAGTVGAGQRVCGVAGCCGFHFGWVEHRDQQDGSVCDGGCRSGYDPVRDDSLWAGVGGETA